MKKKIKVAVTGAAGNIGYALLFRLASGEVFGHDTDVELRLLELEHALPALNGVKMELGDSALPCLTNLVTTSNVDEVFVDVDWALLVGSVPRKAGMERGDLLRVNGGIFTTQGKAIDKNAKANCKVLVIGNPCNTNALIARSHCSRVSGDNFYAMTMLDEKRAVSQLAIKSGFHSSEVKKMAIWGNHSATQYPDFYQATINGKKVIDLINEYWLQNIMIENVQKRGAAIIQARGLSSAASAANAVVESIKAIITPTKKDNFFSLAIPSNGSYDIPRDIIFSFPMTFNGEQLKIVSGIEHNDFAREKIKITIKELISERDAVKDLLA